MTAPENGPIPGEFKAPNSLIRYNLVTISDLLQALNIIIFTVSSGHLSVNRCMLCLHSQILGLGFPQKSIQLHSKWLMYNKLHVQIGTLAGVKIQHAAERSAETLFAGT